MSTNKLRVGIIGSQFVAEIHAAAWQMVPEEGEVVAVASPTPGVCLSPAEGPAVRPA